MESDELQFLTTNLDPVENVRRETWNGREYIVAPLAMIPHGVMAGSKGPLYYPERESKRTINAWEGEPIVVYHPTDPKTGQNLSAKSPGVIERSGIGMVRKPWHDGKSRAEGWFDVEHTRNYDKKLNGAVKILPRLERGEPIELSTGLYTDNKPKRGTFNGQSYDAEALNHRPDHLAVLPDQKGACSVNDGCGVGVTNAAASCTCANAGTCQTCTANCAGPGGKPGPCESPQQMREEQKPNTSAPNLVKAAAPPPPTQAQKVAAAKAVVGKTAKAPSSDKKLAAARAKELAAKKKQTWNALLEVWNTLGRGNHSLAKRSEHAEELTSVAEKLTEKVKDEDDAEGHQAAADAHMEAALAHKSAHMEAGGAKSTKAEKDYVKAGYHGNKADYHHQQSQTHSASATMSTTDNANPNHGPDGRFSSSDSGGDGFHPADMKSFAAADAEIKHGPKSAKADMAHEEAAKAHIKAAADFLKSGNVSMAKHYENKANEHKSKTEAVFIDNEATMNRTETIEFLTTNCDCWKGHGAALNAMSDDQLLMLSTAKQIADNAKTMPVADEEDEGSADDSSTVDEPKKKGKKPPTDNDDDMPATNQRTKPMTEQEWMASAPPTVTENIRHAGVIVAREKRDIVTRLVANVAADKRNAVGNKLMAKPLEELNEMLMLMPPAPAANQHQPIYAPAGIDFTPAPTNNSGFGLTENEASDVLDIEAERAKFFKRATA